MWWSLGVLVTENWQSNIDMHKISIVLILIFLLYQYFEYAVIEIVDNIRNIDIEIINDIDINFIENIDYFWFYWNEPAALMITNKEDIS